MIEEEKPGYYAVIPSQVRYCKELKYPERLLYGEITSLLNKEGYCFASNRYFAELYEVIPGTISRWINHLQKLGFIKVILIKNENKQIIQRRIYITDISSRNFMAMTYEQNKQYPLENKQYPISRKAKDINLRNRIDKLFNFIINKKGEYPKEEFSSIDEYKKLCLILEDIEMNYTEEMISIFTNENIEKLKIIIFCIKELMSGNKKALISKIKRERLITLYDNCKRLEIENKDSENEIRNFVEYYYASMIRELEK